MIKMFPKDVGTFIHPQTITFLEVGNLPTFCNVDECIVVSHCSLTSHFLMSNHVE